MIYKNQLSLFSFLYILKRYISAKNFRFFYLTSLLIFDGYNSFCVPITLTSPDKRITVTVNLKNKIFYSVEINADPLISNAYLQLNLDNQKLGENPRLIKKIFSAVNTQSNPIVPLKNSTVINKYNLLRLNFKGNFSVEFRAYNDGIAYRFITSKKDSITINSEDAHLNFTDSVQTSYLETASFQTSYEILYAKKNLGLIDKSKMSVMPILFDNNKYKVLLSDADLSDYPAMFVKASGDRSVDAVFPKNPVAYGPKDNKHLAILKEAPYIAKTKGTRTFPWRFMLITDKDKQIIENEMVYNLSASNKLQDTKWIKPGQVTWEWWHNAYVYGVDFKSGYNQDTYKYYIDFASKNKISYILMDEGWAKSVEDPFHSNPTINLPELVSYGKARNVRIILWFSWLTVENNFGVFENLQKQGIAGMKIDFMERSDQWMVNYYTRVAKEAAKYQLLVDFHGAFKPAGLEVTYPNVLSYEGVVGMEQNIFNGHATPDNNVFLPYLRNAVGPMDYTPGAMRSGHPKNWHSDWPNVMSIGTRAHQLSMYIVFESGLQMLADNPFNYMREPEALNFITSTPVTWDETKMLAGTAGEFVVTAKRKGDKWFIGAMTNSTARDLVVNTDFLKKDVNYNITLIKDGINADRQAMDFKQLVKPFKAGDTIAINMVNDGGFVARIEPAN